MASQNLSIAANPFLEGAIPSPLSGTSHPSQFASNAQSRNERLAGGLLNCWGVVLFLAMFSIDREHSGSGIGGHMSANPKLFYRCIPLLIGFPLTLAIDGLYCQLRGLRSLISFPCVAIVWFLGVSLGAAFVSNQLLVGGWKAYEYFFMLYWIAVATSFARSRGSTSPLQLIYQCAGATILYIWIVAAICPSKGFVNWGSTALPMLTCPFPHIVQNHVGFLAVTVFVVAVALDLFDASARPLRWLVTLASLSALILAHTRTAYLAFGIFCLAILVMCVFSKSPKIPRGKRLFYLVAAGCSLMTITIVISLYSGAMLKTVTRGQDVEQMQELSGRTTMWKIAATEFQKKPYVGYGLSVGSRRLNKIREYNSTLGKTNRKWTEGTLNIHSSVLEVLLSAGMLGAAPLLMVWFLWLPWKALTQLQPVNCNSFLALALCLTLLVRMIFVSNLAFYTMDSMILAAIVFSYRDFPESQRSAAFVAGQ